MGIDTYEINTLTEEVLDEIKHLPGHFTVRVDPLSSKKILHDYGFYYCDTLVMPHCGKDKFKSFVNSLAGLSDDVSEEELLAISHGAFVHGRFHRDFSIKRELADLRYDLWLKDLVASRNVLGLLYNGDLAGFIGLEGNKIVLSAVSGKYRGQGLAKYLWSAACTHLFQSGHDMITSSISVANLAMLNVYAALGFRFANPSDIYHLLNKVNDS